jgi:hypothetical protein
MSREQFTKLVQSALVYRRYTVNPSKEGMIQALIDMQACTDLSDELASNVWFQSSL